MRYVIGCLFVCLLAFALDGCKPSTDPIDDAANTITATIVGQVMGDDGAPVPGARVEAYGQSVSTSDKGVFVLKNVVVPRTRCAVMVRKSGYFNGSKATMPSTAGVTMLQLTLQSLGTAQTFSSATGGALTAGDASVAIPGGAIVTSTGVPYSGVVRAFVQYQDPTSPRFYDSFSGDMAARRADGSTAELYSYGVVRVVLQGTAGEELNLAVGSQATLRFPAVDATAPSVPLWYYDENAAIWVEEGAATRQGSFYVGNVNHFTDWNLDRPDSRVAFIEGRVTCGQGIPVGSVSVRIGQRRTITDAQGMYRSRVPADVAFDIEVSDVTLGISAAATPVSPIAEGTTKVVDVSVPCPARVTARILDCDGNATQGIVYIAAAGLPVRVAVTTADAASIVVPPGRAMTLSGQTLDGRTFDDVQIAALVPEQVFDAGDLRACSGTVTTFIDVPLTGMSNVTSLAVSEDGAFVAVLSRNGMNGTMRVIDGATGTLRWEEAFVMAGTPNDFAGYSEEVYFNSDASRVGVHWRGGCVVLNTANGDVLRTLQDVNSVYSMSQDGNTVLVLAASGTRLFTVEVATGNQGQSVTLSTPIPLVNKMRIGTNGLLAGVGFTRQLSAITVVEPSTGVIVHEEPGDTSLNGFQLLGVGQSWSTVLYNASNSGRSIVRRLSDGSTLFDVALGASAVTIYALAANDRTLLYSHATGTVSLVSLDAPNSRRALPVPAPSAGFISPHVNAMNSNATIVVSRLLSPTEEPSIRIWDLR